MKIVKYNLAEEVNIGTAEEPKIERRKGAAVAIECTADTLDANLAIARAEAFEEPIVEDDGQPEIYQPTTEERLAALEAAQLEMLGVMVDG